MTTPDRHVEDVGGSPWVLTVDEAAKILRISRSLAFAAVHAGAIPHLRIGRRILIPRSALEDVLSPGDARRPIPPT
jgi:excisionase family DNA binding protein